MHISMAPCSVALTTVSPALLAVGQRVKCGSTMEKAIQFYIGISYRFLVTISGPTDIGKISI